MEITWLVCNAWHSLVPDSGQLIVFLRYPTSYSAAALRGADRLIRFLVCPRIPRMVPSSRTRVFLPSTRPRQVDHLFLHSIKSKKKGKGKLPRIPPGSDDLPIHPFEPSIHYIDLLGETERGWVGEGQPQHHLEQCTVLLESST